MGWYRKVLQHYYVTKGCIAMSEYDIKKLMKDMKKCQDKKRFQHTIGVSYTAAALAMRYGEIIENAQVAGILHDCAKCLTDTKIVSMCEKHSIDISDSERQSPYLLHGKLGAFLAREKYGVKDENILNAIRYHTTGRPDMSLLEKIVFIADYIEPQRKTAVHLDEIRRIAFLDIDEALCIILRETLSYLKKSDKKIDRTTEQTYHFYQSLGKEKKTEEE